MDRQYSGRVVQIQGGVVDVSFPEGDFPAFVLVGGGHKVSFCPTFNYYSGVPVLLG